MRRITLLWVVVLAASCASADDTTTTGAAQPTTAATVVTTTTTSPATTVTAVTTTSTAPATTTTVSTAGPYEVDEPNITPIEPLPGSAGASGSGCAPGAGELPDGIWFGYVLARSAADIDFDLACFFFGDIAYDEGAKDGEEVNNDYYVRNVNPTLRTIAVAAPVPVYEISSADTSFNAIPFEDWPADPDGYIQCPSDWCGVWLYVNGGDVTEIQEQYIP